MLNFNSVKKPELTIIAPWLSKSDWTELVFKSIVRGAKEKNITFNSVVGFRASNRKKTKNEGSFSFLYPKLKVVEKIVNLVNADTLADRIIIIDSSFVNMKAIRYMAGPTRIISCFVNGGFFQRHDLDRQTMFGYDDELYKYEEGHYSLIDKIFLPSKYALKEFIKTYPSLKNKASYHYYYLNIEINRAFKFFNRERSLYASRHSFEKGFDVVSRLDKKKIKIDFVIGLNNKDFRRKLLKYKSLIVPSRADLFGFCALEALIYDVIPVVPTGLSYDELIDTPKNIKIPSPISAKTKYDIEKIIKIINSMSEEEYRKIIIRAKKNIVKLMNDKEHNFSSALDSVFYGSKK